MDYWRLIDTTQDSFQNKEFLKIFQKIFKESSQQYALMLDKISSIHSTNLYWWVSLTASRSWVKHSLYKEFCIVKTIQSFNKLHGNERKFNFLVSSPSQKAVLEKILGSDCPKIFVKAKKVSQYFLIKDIIRPFYFFLSKCIHVLAINFMFLKFRHKVSITLAEVFLSSSENSDRYYPRMDTFMESKLTKDIYFVPTIINTNIFNFFKIIKNIKADKKNYFFRELYLSLNDLFDAVSYKKRLSKLSFLKDTQEKTDHNDLEILILDSLKNEPFNSLSAEGILNFKFIKNLNLEGQIEILNFIDWWENTPMDKGLNLALNSFFPRTSVRGYMGFVPNKYSFQLSPSKQENLSRVVPSSIGVIGKAFLPILKKLDFTTNAFIAPAFRFEHLKNNISKNKTYFLILPSIFPNEFEEMMKMISKTARLFPEITFIIKPHPGAGKLKISQQNLGLKNVTIDNLSSIDMLLKNAKIIITSSSSAALEGIVHSIPSLIFNHSKLIPESIIPDSIPKYLWKSFSDIDGLNNEIKQFQRHEMNSSTQKNVVNLNHYFNLPTNKNVYEFFLKQK